MNFVFVSLQRINTERESTSTSIARELARQGHSVLFVNSPIDRKDFFIAPHDQFVLAHLHAIKSGKDSVQQLSQNLWVLYPAQVMDSFNWVPFTFLFSELIRINNSRFADDIRLATQKLGFKDYILVNDKDIFRGFYLKELLKPSRFVYLDRDNTVAMPYWRRHGSILEPVLMRKSDVVLCNSLDFTKRALQYNANSFYIGNGFDAAQFSEPISSNIPDDLDHIPHPRIGYVGALITLRLDLVLLLELAKARPQWSFVLIGREDNDFLKSELHDLPNVFFLGYKHTVNVPQYIANLDVCINPQQLNEITRGNFPLKILEYLALGKPIVATTTNTMLEVFYKHVYLASNKEEYLVQIENALNENNEKIIQERLLFVKEFSWENIVSKMIPILNKN